MKCIQAMHHCLLSALANVLALSNLISLSSHRDSYSQKREDCNTLTPKWDPTSQRCKNQEPVQSTKPAMNVLKEANRGIFSFTFSSQSQFSAAQCKHHPFCKEGAEVRSVPSSSPASRLRCLHATGALWARCSPGRAWTSPGKRNKNPSKYFLLERDNFLQSSEAMAEL